MTALIRFDVCPIWYLPRQRRLGALLLVLWALLMLGTHAAAALTADQDAFDPGAAAFSGGVPVSPFAAADGEASVPASDDPDEAVYRSIPPQPVWVTPSAAPLLPVSLLFLSHSRSAPFRPPIL